MDGRNPRSGTGRGTRGLLGLERALWSHGLRHIAGVDEAGMGPLAGPVVAAAVILPQGLRIRGAMDSKLLAAAKREALDRQIRRRAVAFGIGEASVEEIEAVNIFRAGLLAMRRALDALSPKPEYVLVDARTLPDLPWPQEAHIRGDARIHCVACASILAKVRRDRLMAELDQLYPEYGFARHKGYATAEHRNALARHGPSPVHRRTFHGVLEEAEQLEMLWAEKGEAAP